jgi:hypothetical protein
MSDTVNEISPVAEVDVVGQIIKDPEIRKLPAGSEEYKVAVEKLSAGKKTTEATADAEGDDRTSAEDEDGTPKKSKSGLEKRFSTLTSERDEARRKAAELEERLKQLEANSNVQRETQEVSFVGQEFQTAKPDVNSFDSYAEYVEALADWKIEKREWDREQKQVVAEAQEKQKEVLGSWEAREKATKERVEGYDQLVDQDFVQAFTKTVASKEAMMFLLESDNGPDLLFNLAEDDAKLAGFKSMSPVKQVAYLAKMESQFEQVDEKETTKVSKAPPPSKSLPKGKTTAIKSIDPTGPLSFSDYQEWRKQQKRK